MLWVNVHAYICVSKACNVHLLLLSETDSTVKLAITSDLTINSVLASLKQLLTKRGDFFRNICVLLTIVSENYQIVTTLFEILVVAFLIMPSH